MAKTMKAAAAKAIIAGPRLEDIGALEPMQGGQIEGGIALDLAA